ncbi:C39 family peptidase [Nocardia salmonicida]|uniref:C39 family peptidase n=1 Tax=Nocardia salmonicida TaxID=53431 RepID=UPI00363F785D
MAEKVLPYDRTLVKQETAWSCGPASAQTVLQSRGIRIAEQDLLLEIEALEHSPGWDDQDGTDHIRQVAAVLNGHLDGAAYEVVEMPNDPPAPHECERLWEHITRSIGADYGVVANIVAPVSNQPRAVEPSTISPDYGRFTVWHYIPIMGYTDEGGWRRVWIADSGFYPYGYWADFGQLCSLIPPKGYTWAAGAPALVDRPVLTAEILSQAMGQALPIERYAELLPAVSEALRTADCLTVDRAAMWMAQVGTESGGLRYMEEIRDGSAYEGRSDLGNIEPGDGRRFKGRGPIQITGRHNYGELSQWAHSRGIVPSPTFFVDHPGELATDHLGFAGVTWYWTAARPMNTYADAGDIVGATRAVNGGTNGLDDRIRRWNHCRTLGAALLPGDDMASLEGIEKKLDWLIDQLGPGLEIWGEDGDLGRNAKGERLTFRAGLAKALRLLAPR